MLLFNLRKLTGYRIHQFPNAASYVRIKLSVADCNCNYDQWVFVLESQLKELRKELRRSRKLGSSPMATNDVLLL
jgi:hypothetical protein